jgi:Glyoxalase-like domain
MAGSATKEVRVYSIDHVVLAVADLDRAGERLHREHGLASVAGGTHPRWGTGNRIVPLGDSYVELIAVVDHEVGSSTPLGRALLASSADGRDRWFSVCLSDTELEATARRLGLEQEAGARRRPDGVELRWRGAGIEDEARDAWLPFFISWDVSADLHPGRTAIRHEVDVTGIASVEIAGDPARLRVWLGPEGDALPIDVSDGDPQVRAVDLSLADGATLRL